MRCINVLPIALLALLVPLAQAQTNLTLLGHLDYQALHASDINSIWGYSDGQGNEYALIGVTGNIADVDSSGGMSIVDVTDPANPVEVFFLPGSYCGSYEAQVWGDHAYVTSRCGGGLRIVDLSPLPQSHVLPVVSPDVGVITAHTTFIDEQGRLYVNGGNLANGGVAMFNLTQDPNAPVEVGEFSLHYAHDSFARGDTLYVAHISDGVFSMVDVTDPATPVLLGTQYSPSFFTHNLALDGSGQHLFTTDEVQGGVVGAFDISDPTDIQQVDEIRSGAEGTIPHNAYWIDAFLAVSYYVHGVVVYDAMRPANLVEVAHFDTSPLENVNFHGAWGVYPYLPSQHLVVSDMEEGLFVLAPGYQRACWLEGTVTNSVTGSPVPNATVTILGPGVSDVSDINGRYATGYSEAGICNISVTAPGYAGVALYGFIMLVNGEVTVWDIELTPLPNTDITGAVREAVSNFDIADAQVVFTGEDLTYTSTTDAAGEFFIPNMVDGTYDITAGHWGHRTLCQADVVIGGGAPAPILVLEAGYYDDFALDLGWTVSGVADTGAWVLGVPIATTFSGPSNPGLDLPDDCGAQAYMTGNGAVLLSPAYDRVRRHETWLTSPVFDIGWMPDPHVRYARWFSDRFGSVWDDTLDVMLTNGVDTVRVEAVTRALPGHSTWRPNTVRVADYLLPTGSMRFLLKIVDEGMENVLEAALDRFEVFETAPVGVPEPRTDPMVLNLWPNPNSGSFMVASDDSRLATIEIRDAQGRLVQQEPYGAGASIPITHDLAPGVYTVSFRTSSAVSSTRMVVVR